MREVKRRVGDLEVIWRAFELRPEPVPLPDGNSEYFRRIWEQGVSPLARRLGVRMIRPEVKPRSRLAHRAAAWARAQGRFDAMNEAIFRAYFERGEDIGQPAVLIELARVSGLDGQSLRLALESGERLEEILSDERQAERYGLTGVPAFIAGGTVLFGVQSADALEEFIRLAHNTEAARPGKGPLPHLPIKITRHEKEAGDE